MGTSSLSTAEMTTTTTEDSCNSSTVTKTEYTPLPKRELTPNSLRREAADDPYVKQKVKNLKKPFNTLVIGSKAKKHTPLLQRPLCESLEDRVDHFVKRRRIVRVEKSIEEDGDGRGTGKSDDSGDGAEGSEGVGKKEAPIAFKANSQDD